MSAGVGKSVCEYGEWESPLTAKFITSAGVGMSNLKSTPSGDLFWLESRPQEGGRNVLCRRDPSAFGASERGGVDVSPKEMNIRTRVHEYGGGAFTIGADPASGETVAIFSNFANQRLYKLRVDAGADTDAAPTCLTPESDDHPSEPAAVYRFADGVIDVKRNRYICVREDHSTADGSAAKVVNAVVSVALDGSGETKILVQGNDFYAAPRLSPDGTKLAYVTWKHPNMPWDVTVLAVAGLDDNGNAKSEVKVVDETASASVLQPLWSPTSGELHFVSDASNGFWNIHCVAGSASATPDASWASRVVNVLPKEADFSGAAPGWAFGSQGFTFLPDGRIVTAYSDREAGGSRLVVIDKQDGQDAGAVKEFSREDGLPYTFGGLTPVHDGSLLLLGAAPDTPWGIHRTDVLKGGTTVMLACSMKEDSRIDPSYISTPAAISFATPDPASTGCAEAFGYFYSPRNAKYDAPANSLPPLLVKAHGGPTACTGTSFNAGIQFWTSRGFAVLDVDYRGSTGYGRKYRQALRGNWGICDIEDVVAGAEHLVKQGLVDPRRLAIDGGSAGGYTTLGALAFKNTFTAGCSLYGVADLSALAGDTHKFESRYLDSLVGRWPEDEAIYKERAPIHSAESLSCPVLLLQGSEDKIVPPNQAELMHKVLLEKGIPTALKMYEGEQHGFRKAENIQDALNSELYFYGKCWGFNPFFNPAGEGPAYTIDNL